MSVILKALAKAQRRYTANAKAVLRRSAGTQNEADGTAQSEPSTISASVDSKGNSVVSIAIIVALAGFAGTSFLMNQRVTSRMNLTNDQIASMLNHIKEQEATVAHLSESIANLETASGAQTKQISAGFEKLNTEITAKIGNLKGELNNQKAVWDSAIGEQGQAVAKTREQLESFKNENKDLKSQIELLKEKVDAIINVPMTP